MANSTNSNQLLLLKRRVVEHFTESDWQELGLITNFEERVNYHPRLLRSMRFGDDDYEGCVITILREMIEASRENITVIENYLNQKYPDESGEFVSSEPAERKITFAPNVFKVPTCQREHDLVAVMMPFAGFNDVYATIGTACKTAGFRCLRADDIWDNSTFVQDIFDLIFRSHIVITDFSGKNPNVMYETGIAHCLGRNVIPISQHKNDIPSDLGHHRACLYLQNSEGLRKLETELVKRLRVLSN
jgi:hypothetical protein